MGCASSNLQVGNSRKKTRGFTVLPECFNGRPRLEMMHFNDVYNIEERALADPDAPVDPDHIMAGASRFVSAFDQRDSDCKLVLFSGDLFSPSHCKCGYFKPIQTEILVVSTHLKGE